MQNDKIYHMVALADLSPWDAAYIILRYSKLELLEIVRGVINFFYEQIQNPDYFLPKDDIQTDVSA